MKFIDTVVGICKDLNLKGVSKSTWVIVITDIFVVINGILVACGHAPVEANAEQIYATLSMVATGIMMFVSAWKNCSFTRKAQESDKERKSK